MNHTLRSTGYTHLGPSCLDSGFRNGLDTIWKVRMPVGNKASFEQSLQVVDVGEMIDKSAGILLGNGHADNLGNDVLTEDCTPRGANFNSFHTL